MNNNSVNIVRCVFYISTILAVPSNTFLLIILMKHQKMKDTLFPFFIQGTAIIMLAVTILYATIQPVVLIHDGMHYMIFAGVVLPETFKYPLFFLFSFLKILCFLNSYFGFIYRYFIISRGMSTKSKGVITLVLICVLITFTYGFIYYKIYRNALDDNDLDLLYYVRVVRSYTYSQLPVSSIYMSQFNVKVACFMNIFRLAIVITSAILHYLTITKPFQLQNLSQRRVLYNRELNQVCNTTAVIVYCFMIGPYFLMDVFSLFNLNTHLFTLPFEAFSAATTVVVPVICITNKVQQEQSISNK